MLDAIWGVFFQVLSWMIYPSTENPVLPVIGLVVVSIIILGFLKMFGFVRKYPNG